LKNRFVYKFHFDVYTESEKQSIIHRYIEKNNILLQSPILLEQISEYISSVPRDIATACIQLRDYLTAHYSELVLDQERWMHFWQWRKLDK
jgi:Holliday junction resolvasome RuvABC ATP-dependent DNA helicase subunit